MFDFSFRSVIFLALRGHSMTDETHQVTFQKTVMKYMANLNERLSQESIITARNEVGARVYVHRHLWFCPQRGHAWPGGMHGWGGCGFGGMCGCGGVWLQRACMAGGHAWWGVHGGMCVAGGMHGRGACVAGGMCMPGVCMAGGVRDMHTPLGRYYSYGIRSMTGRYASYWNAFLFDIEFSTGTARNINVLFVSKMANEDPNLTLQRTPFLKYNVSNQDS